MLLCYLVQLSLAPTIGKSQLDSYKVGASLDTEVITDDDVSSSYWPYGPFSIQI